MSLTGAKLPAKVASRFPFSHTDVGLPVSQKSAVNE